MKAHTKKIIKLRAKLRRLERDYSKAVEWRDWDTCNLVGSEIGLLKVQIQILKDNALLRAAGVKFASPSRAIAKTRLHNPRQ